jgi:Flp pilus assembly protein TadD
MKATLAAMILAVGVFTVRAPVFADLPEPKGKSENANIAAGRKSIEAQDFKSAVGHLTKAVQEEPNNADAHSMLGYSYRKLGTFDRSMERSRSTPTTGARANTWASSIST